MVFVNINDYREYIIIYIWGLCLLKGDSKGMVKFLFLYVFKYLYLKFNLIREESYVVGFC